MQGVHVVIPQALVQIVAVLGEAGRVHNAEVGVLRRRPCALRSRTRSVPGGRLPDVVESRPHKLAGHKIGLDGSAPGLRRRRSPVYLGNVVGGQLFGGVLAVGIAALFVDSPAVDGRRRLRAVDLPVRMLLVEILHGLPVGVVDAHQAAGLRQVVLDLREAGVAVFQAIVADGERPGIIRLLRPLDENGRLRHIVCLVSAGSLGDLISQGPGDDGRGVPIPADHGLQVELRPGHALLSADDGVGGADLLFEEPAVVLAVGVLGIQPAVKGLLDHQHSQLVADFDQVPGRRVVGHADRVASHIPQDLHLPADGRLAVHRSQSSLVVVHADALQLHVFPVEGKSRVAVKFKIPVAKLRAVGVCHLSAGLHLGLHHVELRAIQAPEVRIGDRGFCFKFMAGAGGDDRLLRLGAGHRRPVPVPLLVEGVDQFHRLLLLGVVVHRGGDHRPHPAGVSLPQIRRRHLGPVEAHVNRVRDRQIHAAVDSAPGIPAAGGSLVIHLHGDHILLPELDIVRQVVGKRRVAVGMISHLLAIDVYGGIHVNPVKIDAHPFARLICGDGEILAVPSDSSRQIATLRLHSLGILLLDAVIVGQGQASPGGVIVGRLLPSAHIPQIKLPVVVKIL